MTRKLAETVGILVLVAAGGVCGSAQTVETEISSSTLEARAALESVLPDAPSAVAVTASAFSTSGDHDDAANRISLAWRNSTHHPAHPTPSQRWHSFVDHTFSPSALRGDLLDAAQAQFHHAWPEYGKGFPGFEKRYGAILAGHAAGNFFGTYLFPTLLHQSPRSPRLGPGHSVWRRFGYAVSRVAVTRDDYGNETLNSSLLLTTAGTSSVANLYYPRDQRGWSPTASRFEGSLMGNLQGNLSREFLPDIQQFLWKHAPARLQRLAPRLPCAN